MKIFKISFYFFLYLAVTGCSNTAPISSSPMNNHYYTNNFSHNNFSANHQASIKKNALSDQQLMISLLNRPIPEDQRMMLAFTKRQATYLPDSTIVGIQIKGKKTSDNSNPRASSKYAHLIEQDINAIIISAMPQ